MEATLRALEAVEGDLSDGQRAFQAALARTALDAPNGHIRLDENRQAIAPNYLQKVTKTAMGLTMRTHATLPDVEQSFNGYFDSSEPLRRDALECRKGDPPAWAHAIAVTARVTGTKRPRRIVLPSTTTREEIP